MNIEDTRAKIAELQALWQSAAAAGKHGAAVDLKNEIRALEDAVERLEIQGQAERIEAARIQAVEAAKATSKRIERHRAARVELEAVVTELEAAAKAVDEAMGRLRPAWSKCRVTWPAFDQFPPVQQEAYNEALGADKYPHFDPLRLGLRLPAVVDILTERGNRGLADILSMADARF